MMAVAAGAVLRALDKTGGPSRWSKSSYGILRSEPYMKYPEHSDAKSVVDKFDKMRWVKDTIYWVLECVCRARSIPLQFQG